MKVVSVSFLTSHRNKTHTLKMDNSGNSTSSDVNNSKDHRGGNHTADEYVALARAYTYVSTDAIVDVDQKGNQCFIRIHDAYK